MQWHLHSSQIPQTDSELLAIIAENRQIKDLDAFFQPASPLKMPLAEVDLSEEVVVRIRQRLEQAKKLSQKVVIFGDYDADGICSTAVMWEGLKAFGITAMPFIPQREKHGYGLSMRSVEGGLLEMQPELVITVDNGIVAHQAVQFLQDTGIDVIVTDHHQPELDADGAAVLPPAFAVFHTTALCGTTVAWMLARELSAETAANSLDLCAVGTIADQVPLIGANRVFAVAGIEALRKSKRVGIQILLEQSKTVQAEISSTGITYAIAPRINAMGRLKHGMDALRLLCTKNQDRAWQLAEVLAETNQDRQTLTEDMLQHALQQAESWQDQHVIVVVSESYHEGVIGLIASKLTERFYKPSIVISLGENLAKASARSIPDVNITELLRQTRQHLVEVGGHAMAAGFSVLPANLEAFTAAIRQVALAQILPAQLQPSIEIECQLPAELCTVEVAQALDQFAPFGQGNREPHFLLSDAQVLAVDVIGRNASHLKLKVELDSGEVVTALWWGAADKLEKIPLEAPVSLAAKLSVNVWKNKKSVQLEIKDLSIG